MKTKHILHGIFITLGLAVVLSGCENESNKQLLSDGIWTFSDLTSDTEDQTLQTFTLIAKALLTDATLEFQEDGNYLISSPLSEEPSTGTWQLIGNDQLIMTSEGDLPSTGNIETLTKEKLSYIETMVDDELGTYSVTTTWVR